MVMGALSMFKSESMQVLVGITGIVATGCLVSAGWFAHSEPLPLGT